MINRHRMKSGLRAIALLVAGCAGVTDAIARAYSLAESVQLAQQNDPWMEGSRLRQQKLEALSVSAGTLPDPTLSVGFANLPTDSFDLDQEAMTQLKVGVSQLFPRGKSLSLRREQLEKLSQIQTSIREDRLARTAVVVAHLWLEVYRHQKTIALIENERSLFEHLVDVAESSYRTASGRTRQQDLIRAQLELTRLEDRLITLHQLRDAQLAQLGEWLDDDINELSIAATDTVTLSLAVPGMVSLSNNKSTFKCKENNHAKRQQLSGILTAHPAVRAIDKKLLAEESGVKLAQQSYQPQWGLNASYSLREDDQLGSERSDFLSVGVSIDLPVFTEMRQDKQVQAAISAKEAVKTERALSLRKLRAGFETARANYQRLNERKSLFDSRLLQEMLEQEEASLIAYTSDDGDFAEVVRARIGELNAKIESLNINIDIQKTIAQINYFLAGGVTNSIFNTAAQFDLNDAAGDAHEQFK